MGIHKLTLVVKEDLSHNHLHDGSSVEPSRVILKMLYNDGQAD